MYTTESVSIAQLVEHCTGIAEVNASILRYQCTPNDHHSLAPFYGWTFDANPSKEYIF